MFCKIAGLRSGVGGYGDVGNSVKLLRLGGGGLLRPYPGPVILRCEPLRRAAKDDGPDRGRFILRSSPSGATALKGSHLRMTGRHDFAFSRRVSPEVFKFVSPP